MTNVASNRQMIVFFSESFKDHAPPKDMNHPETPERLDVCVKAIRNCPHLSPLMEWKETQSVDITVNSDRRAKVLDFVKLVHDSNYLEYVQTLCHRAVSESVMMGEDTYIRPRSFDVALLAASAWMEAVDVAVTSKAALALARPPGHHAVRTMPVSKENSGGFCILCNAAIAARYALKQPGVSCVAIIDFDEHHGNGTQDAVSDLENVKFVSIHQSDLFPKTGRNGRFGKYNQLLNVALSAGCGMKDLMPFLEKEILPFMFDEKKPDIVIVSAGFDALDVDPLPGLSFKPKDFKELTSILVSKAGPDTGFVFGLEGGYSLKENGTGEALRQCIAGYCLRSG